MDRWIDMQQSTGSSIYICMYLESIYLKFPFGIKADFKSRGATQVASWKGRKTKELLNANEKISSHQAK